GRSPEILRRRIPDQLVVKSLVMLVLAFSFISAAVFALLATEQDTVLASSSHGGLRLMFEAVSAFATTGLSVGVTPRLTEAGKLIIITCMFLGRIGPLTLVLAISARRAQRFEYPKEGVMIG
ncbi:MAG TPA: potassium transporter TrkG, partial [Planctomycetota bacterium]|nr:potassium transporter TrkG [Planctomycetota bacterium]